MTIVLDSRVKNDKVIDLLHDGRRYIVRQCHEAGGQYTIDKTTTYCDEVKAKRAFNR